MIKQLFSNNNPLTALLLIVSFFFTFTATAASLGEEKPLAADFTLPSKSGENMRLQEQRGNVVLINFWASWCGPCREELPHMETLQQDFQDLGFTILAVNVDEDPSKANILLDEIAHSFPVLFDQDNKVSKLYQVKAMPSTVIVDRDGKQRLLHYGYKSGDEDTYRQVIKALLRE
jgi:peroxiredoxin